MIAAAGHSPPTSNGLSPLLLSPINLMKIKIKKYHKQPLTYVLKAYINILYMVYAYIICCVNVASNMPHATCNGNNNEITATADLQTYHNL